MPSAPSYLEVGSLQLLPPLGPDESQGHSVLTMKGHNASTQIRNSILVKGIRSSKHHNESSQSKFKDLNAMRRTRTKNKLPPAKALNEASLYQKRKQANNGRSNVFNVSVTSFNKSHRKSTGCASPRQSQDHRQSSASFIPTPSASVKILSSLNSNQLLQQRDWRPS